MNVWTLLCTPTNVRFSMNTATHCLHAIVPIRARITRGPHNERECERESQRCVLIKCSSADIRYFITQLCYVYTELRSASFSPAWRFPTFDTPVYTCTRVWLINRENIITKVLRIGSELGDASSNKRCSLYFAITFATTLIFTYSRYGTFPLSAIVEIENQRFSLLDANNDRDATTIWSETSQVTNLREKEIFSLGRDSVSMRS